MKLVSKKFFALALSAVLALPVAYGDDEMPEQLAPAADTPIADEASGSMAPEDSVAAEPAAQPAPESKPLMKAKAKKHAKKKAEKAKTKKKKTAKTKNKKKKGKRHG